MSKAGLKRPPSCWAGAFDGSKQQIRPTPKRVWRCRFAIQQLCSRRRVLPKEVEKVLGHCSFMALIRRELLAIFRATYVFINRFRRTLVPVPIWPSVVRELRQFHDLTPLLYRDFKRSCWDRVLAFDASLEGFGVVRVKADVGLIRDAGRYRDRRRFRKDAELSSLRNDALRSLLYSTSLSPKSRPPPGSWGQEGEYGGGHQEAEVEYNLRNQSETRSTRRQRVLKRELCMTVWIPMCSKGGCRMKGPKSGSRNARLQKVVGPEGVGALWCILG
jgi:hypothetical protein